MCIVLSAVARARQGVGPTPGFTVKRVPGAGAAAVMPGVTGTPGQATPSEAPTWQVPGVTGTPGQATSSEAPAWQLFSILVHAKL